MPTFTLDTWSSSTVVARLDELAKIYTEVYAEPPYNAGSLWSAEAFVARTRRQATLDGFSFLAASIKEEIAGFAFGLTFGEGVWWSGHATAPPDDILTARKFAVIELVVRRRWRGRGIGHQLVNQLLADRSEGYAILTAMPGAAAREMYRRWGWTQTGTAHHAPDSPILDALILPLPADRVSAKAP